MSTILTLTTNLLAETTMEFAAWVEGKTQRATAETFQVGGKGINVTRMLSRLDASSLALCFPGGDIGRKCEHWLVENQVPFQAFPTPLDTRIGTVVRTPENPETTFLGLDCALNPASVQACCDFLAAQPTGTGLAISGSIQFWDTPLWDPLREELLVWIGHQTLVADTYGPPLRWMAEAGPALIKLNRVEFSSLMGDTELTPEAVPATLVEAVETYPVERWVVSDGAGPIWFVERGSLPASIIPPPIREVSPTGSGDILFAGILDGLLNRGLPFRRCIEIGCLLATASAARPGIADFPDEVIVEAYRDSG